MVTTQPIENLGLKIIRQPLPAPVRGLYLSAPSRGLNTLLVADDLVEGSEIWQHVLARAAALRSEDPQDRAEIII